MVAADGSGGAFAAAAGAGSPLPHADTLTTSAAATPAAAILWERISYLLLGCAGRRAPGFRGRRPEPAQDQGADLGDVGDPQPARQARLLDHGVTLVTPDAHDEGLV